MSSWALALLATVASAATVTYDWNVTWTSENPDGLHDRPTMGINGQWPPPLVKVNRGDQLVVNVNNQLGNQSTSVHFHGMYQNGTTHMDGPVGVSQCQVPPGNTFTYNFTADQVGTYWYHSHIRGQYPDGLRAPMLIHDPDGPYEGKYDEELVWTLSDWYHDQMPDVIPTFINVLNPTGAEPVPDAALMNDKQNDTIKVQPGKTYLVHLVNMGAFANQYFWIEGHNMTVVEVDGVWTEPMVTDQIYITVAQRYSFLVTMRNDTSANFPITGAMDQDLFDTVPETLVTNVTSWLVYDQSKPMPAAAMLNEYDPLDDFSLVPYDKQETFQNPAQQVVLDMKMDNLGDGANYAFFNDVTYVKPKVPTLYSALSTGVSAENSTVYGVNTNSFVLGYNEVVELVLNNHDAGKHPFHLHGHNFQVLARPTDGSGDYDGNDSFPVVPMRRDTLLVRPQSHFVIRFRSDNPGVWLFHCHIEVGGFLPEGKAKVLTQASQWHVDSGLLATMVEAPLELQKKLQIPEAHYQTCRDTNTPYEGNAAANTEDYFNLNGANVSPPPLPDG